MKKIYAAFALALVLVSTPTLAFAQNRGAVSACGRLQSEGVKAAIECAVAFFDYFVYLITALSVVYIVLGAFKLMNEEKRDEGKQTIYYGIIALFVMMSIWGFVNILNNTFRLGASADSVTRPSLIPSR